MRVFFIRNSVIHFCAVLVTLAAHILLLSSLHAGIDSANYGDATFPSLLRESQTHEAVE